MGPTATNRYLLTVFTITITQALLLFVRVVEGLNVIDENTNVAAYVYQIAQRDKRASFMSLLGISTSDILVASVFHVILTATMSENDLQSYGLIFAAIWESMHRCSDHSAYAINATNNVISLPRVLLIGYFTDKTKHKAATLLFRFGQTQNGMNGVWMNWLLQFISTCSYSLIHGCIYWWYISKLLIDARTRVAVFGVGYNLGAVCFGGTASLFGSAFVVGEGSEIGIALLGVSLSINILPDAAFQLYLCFDVFLCDCCLF